MYVNIDPGVYDEIEDLISKDPTIARGRLLGHLISLGLAAYKRERQKGLTS